MGLPLFFDQLIEVLKKRQANVSVNDEKDILATAGNHGKEFLRLGYTLSHVVHAYGAICQSITQIASDTKAPVTAMEFHNLNRCLDIAIAGAVTEFESLRNQETKGREVESLGAMAHELRNALNRAVVASEMIAKGIVSTSGSTSKVLQFSLAEMHRLIERSLSDVKLRAGSGTHEETFLVGDLINQLVVTAEAEASLRNLTLTLQIDRTLSVRTDRHLLFSALDNLVQNAMKFTKSPGNVTLTARAEEKTVIIEVRDQCGGIPPVKMAELFKPFVQQGKDRSGLGLGLTIARRAMEKCQGTLTAFNIEGGCAFRAALPGVETGAIIPIPPVV